MLTYDTEWQMFNDQKLSNSVWLIPKGINSLCVGNRLVVLVLIDGVIPRGNINALRFIHSLTQRLIHSLINCFTHSLTDSITHSLNHPITQSPTHSITHSLTHSVTMGMPQTFGCLYLPIRLWMCFVGCATKPLWCAHSLTVTVQSNQKPVTARSCP